MKRPLFRLLGALALTVSLAALVGGTAVADPKVDPSDEAFVPPGYMLASGGPDRYGYTYADSDQGGCRFGWIEPGPKASRPLGDQDDATVALDIGFPFPFYGQLYDRLTVDSNGTLLFTGGGSDWINRPLETGGPSPRLAPFWDDLLLDSVQAELMGSALERTLVVTFQSREPAARFQALLAETGEITFQYLDLTGERGLGTGASVGIQGPETGLGYLFNGYPEVNRLHPVLAVCFVPPAGLYLSPGLQPGFAPAGEAVRYKVTAVNQTGAHADLNLAVDSEWPATVTPAQGSLLDGETIELTVLVQVLDGPAGERAEAVVRLASQAGAATSARLWTTRASGHYGYSGASTNDTLAILDLDTNSLLTTLSLLPEADYPYDATMRPDGSEVWLVGASGDGVVVVDTISNTISHRISTASVAEYPVDVLFSKYGDRAYVSNRDNLTGQADAVAVIDTASYSVTGIIPIPHYSLGPGKMTLNPCSGLIYMANWYDDRFFVIDPVSQTVTADLSMGTSLWDLVMDPGATTIYVTDRGSDQVHVLEAASLTVETSIDVGDDPWGIAITPDGKLLFVANEDSHDVSVIDAALQVVTTTLALPAADADPRDVAISADGRYAYVPSGTIAGNDAVYVIDTQSLQVIDTIDVAPASNPNVVAVAPQPASIDPVAGFASSSPVPLGVPIIFTDTSTNNPTWWHWDFGDGSGSSTLQNPTYDYADAGTYTVTLTSGNACGSDVFAAAVVVEESPRIYLPVVLRGGS